MGPFSVKNFLSFCQLLLPGFSHDLIIDASRGKKEINGGLDGVFNHCNTDPEWQRSSAAQLLYKMAEQPSISAKMIANWAIFIKGFEEVDGLTAAVWDRMINLDVPKVERFRFIRLTPRPWKERPASASLAGQPDQTDRAGPPLFIPRSHNSQETLTHQCSYLNGPLTHFYRVFNIWHTGDPRVSL